MLLRFLWWCLWWWIERRQWQPQSQMVILWRWSGCLHFWTIVLRTICMSQWSVIINLAVIRTIWRPVRFSTQSLVTYKNGIRHTDVPEIIVVLDDRQPRVIRFLLELWKYTQLPGYPLTEKYATTCHFLVSLVPGRWTSTENVCFVSPLGLDGLSFRLMDKGMSTFGSNDR